MPEMLYGCGVRSEKVVVTGHGVYDQVFSLFAGGGVGGDFDGGGGDFSGAGGRASRRS